jgi:thioredoxin
MSTLNSLLNALVLAGLCVGVYFVLTTPHDFGPPPTDPWFQQVVVAEQRPVLVKFGATWCGPCQAMEGQLDQFQASNGGAVAVVRVDVDQHPGLARHYGISGIPHAFLFEQGKVVADRVGYLDSQQLREWVARYEH